MNKFSVVLLLGLAAGSSGRDPFKPLQGSIPFLVYFPSRYRGMCVGTLVSRSAVLTAAVCVTSPEGGERDRRPISVTTGTAYRHPRRGIRMQVTQILIPRLTNITGDREYLMQKSAAVLLLKHRIPDALVEIPLRALPVEWRRGEENLSLHEECFTAGWHFFYKGDTIYPVRKFLLQRSVRVQFLTVVKKNMWCEALSIKFQKALTDLGFHGYFDKGSSVCVKDLDRAAQPCHGMYGAPLVCRGKLTAVLMAPDAQWTNCTGMSNLYHLLSSSYLSSFMDCVSGVFKADAQPEWAALKESLHTDVGAHYDYIPAMYDKLALASGTSSEDTDEFV